MNLSICSARSIKTQALKKKMGKERKRKKLQKIAHRPARYTARNMLISAVIRMFCGIMVDFVKENEAGMLMLFSLFSLLAILYIYRPLPYLHWFPFATYYKCIDMQEHRNSWRVRLICFITLLFMCSNACFRFYIVPLSR